jgi:hypothetical protein
MKRALFLLSLLLLVSCASPGTVTTPNLFVESQNARATADAAEELAAYQERFLTATAEAPIVHITETAAAQSVQSTVTAQAMAIQQSYWTTTAQSVQETETAAMTQTAMAWTPTPNATSTSVFAVLNAEGTQMANQVQRDNLELERQEYANDFWANLPGLTWAFLSLVLVLGLMLFTRRARYQPAKVDERGNILPMLDIVEGTITDPDRNPNYLSGTRREDLKALPALTADRQDNVTHRDQAIDAVTRGLPGGTRADKRQIAQQMAPKLSGPNMAGRFKILPEGTFNEDVIDGEIISVLDQDWKESENK